MPTTRSLALESSHRDLGAVWTSEDGLRVPAHYGDARRERTLLEDGCGLFDASAADCLAMSGDDRHRFLNGLVTADVRELAPGQSRYGLFTTVKGRILADVTVLARAERFWLRLPVGTGEAIGEHLARHVITDRVEFAPCECQGSLLLVGATATERLARELSDGDPLPEVGAHRAAVVGGIEVTLLGEGRLGLPGYSLWTAEEGLEAVWRRLLEGEGIEPVGLEALEQLRIERGIPRFGREFGPETFPQEAGLDGAVSYEKGCYLGQEVIARIHYRGGVQRQLVQLVGEGERLPDTGTRLVLEDEEVGELTSRSPRLTESGWVGLAVVKLKASAPGSILARPVGETAQVLRAVE